MVRVTFLTASMLVVLAAFFVPVAKACEGDCRNHPIAFLKDKYKTLLEKNLNSLQGTEREQASDLKDKATARMGRVIDKAIFSVYRSNCHHKPPHRSPSEICGSAKSIACNAAWDKRRSVFAGTHKAVMRVLEQTFQDQSQQVRQAMVESVRTACPAGCWDWVQPFQDLMLRWERREHPDEYGNRLPNCAEGSLAY
ncbi:hypothetical protein EC968_004372 [Mortierella alpina]|nr:hypothetical protein EC968_004372 [Mortierella alpina]